MTVDANSYFIHLQDIYKTRYSVKKKLLQMHPGKKLLCKKIAGKKTAAVVAETPEKLLKSSFITTKH